MSNVANELKTYGNKASAERGLIRYCKKTGELEELFEVKKNEEGRFYFTKKEAEQTEQTEQAELVTVEDEPEIKTEFKKVDYFKLMKEGKHFKVIVPVNTELGKNIRDTLKDAAKKESKKKVAKEKVKAEVRNKIRDRLKSTSKGYALWTEFYKYQEKHNGEVPSSEFAKAIAKRENWKEITCITELADWKRFNGLLDKQKQQQSTEQSENI